MWGWPAALAAIVVLAVTASPASGADRCRGEQVHAENARARLLEDRNGAMWSCVRKTGRRVRLRRQDTFDVVAVPRLSGRYAAFVLRNCHYDCADDDLGVYDTRTGRRVVRMSVPAPQERDQRVVDLELRATGVVAVLVAAYRPFEPWCCRTPASAELWMVAGRVKRMVSAGQIDVGSLHRDGASITWVQDGVARTTPFAL